ncbi:YodC family protein [Avibacterium gallinarum]|uniref:YodC family protein n=1 Tax=Avibacterium gallinarum TaxID=755 RepID=UPI003BF91648
MDEIKVGTVVQLKSGGPLMTVISDKEDEKILCKWFDHNKSNEEAFPKEALDIYQENSSLSGFVTEY